MQMRLDRLDDIAELQNGRLASPTQICRREVTREIVFIQWLWPNERALCVTLRDMAVDGASRWK